ncbi:hypothetical protein MKW92_000811 [Papaver armeniacum]|nr:hypothetical protein MKW92_000811 [Papaver armeniacum]
MEEEEQKRVLDLVKELVLRLVSNSSLPEEESTIESEKALKYAMRILGNRMTPSISIDEASMAESIKRLMPSFADLYTKFSSKSGSGYIQNKWSVLYLLKGFFRFLCFLTASVVSLVLVDESSCNSRKTLDKSRIGNGGVLLISKDPENIRDIALRDFANLLKEESEIVEGCLVRDVLYVSKGIDGKYVKFDKNLDGYVLLDSIKVPKPMRIMVTKLVPLEYVGTSRQAFCAALQDELSEYYKLLVVLEVQIVNPIPMVFRIDKFWKLSILEEIVNGCFVDGFKALKGGAMAGAIHMHAQHGDPLVQGVHETASPPLGFWKAELDDIFSEFLLGQPKKAEVTMGRRVPAAFSDAPVIYLVVSCLPHFTDGKSINFLRVCSDQGWAFQVSEILLQLEPQLQDEDLYKFKDHRMAIKRYLILGRGDFVRYLMDIVGPELSEPAHTISSFKLVSFLKVRSDHQIPVMARYLKNLNFLLKLSSVEHALIGSRKTMKPNCIDSHFFKKRRIAQLNLRERSQTLCKTLFVLLDLILRFRSHADRRLYLFEAKTSQSLDQLKRQQSSGHGLAGVAQRAGEFLRNMGHELDRIANEYSSTLEGFIGQLPLQQHVDLKFLLFRRKLLPIPHFSTPPFYTPMCHSYSP